MRKYSRPYVGLLLGGGGREVFRSVQRPTQEMHGARYGAVIGPFRTRRGAEFMAKYGANNPHLPDVTAAEKLAKRESNRA